MRNLDWLAPFPSEDLPEVWEVTRADPKDNSFRCNLFRVGPFQKGREFAEGARANIVKGGDFLAELLVAADKDLGVRKFKLTNDFRQESGFL